MTSRIRIIAPVDRPRSRNGIAWTSTDVSPRSISSVTGTRSRVGIVGGVLVESDLRSSTPWVYEWIPMRCRELIALGS